MLASAVILWMVGKLGSMNFHPREQKVAVCQIMRRWRLLSLKSDVTHEKRKGSIVNWLLHDMRYGIRDCQWVTVSILKRNKKNTHGHSMWWAGQLSLAQATVSRAYNHSSSESWALASVARFNSSGPLSMSHSRWQRQLLELWGDHHS